MKASIPKGTRDFLPKQVEKRSYIFGCIKDVFKKFGYVPIETPSMENLETLTGKYGEEGDKLLFKILNNGDYLAKADPTALENKDSQRLIPSISKRGLRYDLTVPFARYVVMHQNELYFPFKRYQIQPVWRADRPQKGRYQEFSQCDADVVGSKSLMYEAELIQICDQVFTKLGLNVSIKINNRKVLQGIAEVCDIQDHFEPMTVAIDKLDKIGMQGVRNELSKLPFSETTVDQIEDLLQEKNLVELRYKLQDSPVGIKGIEELETVFSYLKDTKLVNGLEFDITLARGLNYYTGSILEVKSNDIEMGSLAGGGRYDDLTGVFGLKNMPGVGISFGAERLYDALEETNGFPEEAIQSIQVLMLALDTQSHQHAFEMITTLRAQGIWSDLYPEPAKMKKQMKYANAIGVPFVIIVGEEERSTLQYSLKNMEEGTQELLSLDQIIKKIGSTE